MLRLRRCRQPGQVEALARAPTAAGLGPIGKRPVSLCSGSGADVALSDRLSGRMTVCGACGATVALSKRGRVGRHPRAACIHRWRIDEPSGPLVPGTCRLCGEVRQFVTGAPDSVAQVPRVQVRGRGVKQRWNSGLGRR